MRWSAIANKIKTTVSDKVNYCGTHMRQICVVDERSAKSGKMVSGCRRQPRFPPKPNYNFLAHLQCSLKFACKFHSVVLAGPSPGFSSRGGQKPGGAKNQKGGPRFKNTVLDVCSNQGVKREMEGQRVQMAGPGTTGPPSGDGPRYLQ